LSVFVISDVHGNYDGLLSALEEKKIIDKHGNRQLARKHTVISIGDLANCVESNVDGDAACLSLVGPVIDKLIIGNHEMPYLDNSNEFNGFYWYPEICHMILGLLKEEKIIGSFLRDKTLITHAGVSRRILSVAMKVEEVHENIKNHFDARNWNSVWFSSVGRARGGRNNCGGILWCDFEEEFMPTSFPQIVGHTPRCVRMKGNSICIDVGGQKEQNKKPFILEVK